MAKVRDFRDDRGRARSSMNARKRAQLVFFVDVTIEIEGPMVVSNFSVPEASGNFLPSAADASARTSSNEKHGAGVLQEDRLHRPTSMPACARSTWRNPYQPKEIGYFIPPITEATDKRCIKVDGVDRCKTAIQSNNVENRRPRLHLRGRSRQYRHAYSGAERRSACDRRAAITLVAERGARAGARKSASRAAIEPGHALVGLLGACAARASGCAALLPAPRAW